MRAALVALLLISIAVSAHAWGKEGHTIVAEVAKALLTTRAQSFMSPFVSPADMPNVASWADSIKSQYPWSSSYHFVDTPAWTCNYQHDRDCPKDNCITSAVRNYTLRAIDKTLSSAQRTEAIKFIIHFAGDSHCPVHTGFTSDRGGNDLKVTFFGQSTNLHFLWDDVPEKRDDDFQNVPANYAAWLVQQIKGTWASQAATWASCTEPISCVDTWVQESVLAACKFAYTEQDGTHVASGASLGQPYYDYIQPILDLQLAKAGVRLAAVLDRMAVQFMMKQFK